MTYIHSTNWGVSQYGLPAERQGGLTFLERFKSQAEVENNGGTLFNSPTVSNGVTLNGSNQYIRYGGLKLAQNKGTIFAKKVKLDPTATAENTIYSYSGDNTDIFKLVAEVSADKFRIRGIFGELATRNDLSTGYVFDFDVEYDIVFCSTGAAYKCFVNGVNYSLSIVSGANNGNWLNSVNPINPFNYIGVQEFSGALANYFKGSIEEVRLYNHDLQETEALAYYSGTMWNYDRNCVLWMDGKFGGNGRPGGYDPDNLQHLDASGNANHLTLTSGWVKNNNSGYSNSIGTATMHCTLNETISSSNSGNQSMIWFGNIRDTGFAPLMGNSNFAIGLTSSQTIYSRSFKPDKTYTNRITTGTINLNQSNFICSVKQSNILSVYINGIKDVLTANETGYERDISKLAIGYDLNTYADLKDLTTTTDCDPSVCIFFPIAINPTQIRDLKIRLEEDRGCL